MFRVNEVGIYVYVINICAYGVCVFSVVFIVFNIALLTTSNCICMHCGRAV